MTNRIFSSPPFLLMALALFCASTAARAGFEWRGPVEPPMKKEMTAPQVASPEMSDLEPVLMWEGAASSAPAPAMPAEKAPMVETIPAEMPGTSPVVSASEETATTEDVLDGFGSDMPLVIALQQVVPAGFQFSFASGVNPGAPVSWQGGKPWKAVLADMLSTQGLGFRVHNGNVVTIGYFASETTAPVPVHHVQVTPPIVATQASPVTASPAETVTIRRQKPSSLLDRFRSGFSGVPESPSAAEIVQPEPEAVVPMTVPAEASAQPVPLNISTPAPVVAAPATITAAVPADPVWQGAKGQTLRDVLKSWSDVAGVELYWTLDYDYRLQEDAAFSGTYDEAVGKVLDRFATVRPQPYGQLHQADGGSRVLVVKSYDVTN